MSTEEPRIIKQLRELDQDLSIAIKRIDMLESHINKLHEMINLEDRITASDVLCRLTVLESENKMRQDTIACVDRAYDEECEKLWNHVKELERFQNITHGQYQKIICNGSHHCATCTCKTEDPVEAWKNL